MLVTVENMYIKERDGVLDVYELGSHEHIATITNESIIIFKKDLIMTKETICYLNNIFLDVPGYVILYKNRQPGLFDF